MTPAIVQCACGAKVRVPTDLANRSLRCPKCKTAIAVPEAAIVAAPVPQSDSNAPICPICQSPIASQEVIIKCEACDQMHHLDCWQEIGGCSTYGCAKAPTVDKSAQSVQSPLTAWGDTKKCPACGEMIKSIALRCRYCGTDFHSVDPLSVADLHKHAAVEDKVAATRRNAIVVLVLSIVGMLAPLMLVVSLVFVLRKRELLAKTGPLFVVMGWAAVVLSAFYSLLMLAFLAAESLK